jgi:hypothetical protein
MAAAMCFAPRAEYRLAIHQEKSLQRTSIKRKQLLKK